MAASLLALLSQQTPNLQTRKGLLLLGLQNDFLAPDGKLPVSNASEFVPKLRSLVPAFREFGDVIWVNNEFDYDRMAVYMNGSTDMQITGPLTADEATLEAELSRHSPSPPKRARTSLDDQDRPSRIGDARDHVPLDDAELVAAHNEQVDEDRDMLLMHARRKEPPCVVGSYGAAHPTDVLDLIHSKDLQVTKSSYSAFGGTSLLPTLRSKLVTELYICGNHTNFSVYATALDAARFGMKITLVEDCLGYRRKDRHDLALQQLRNVMEARVTTAEEVVEILQNPRPSPDESDVTYDDDEFDDAIEDEDNSVQEDENSTTTNLHDTSPAFGGYQERVARALPHTVGSLQQSEWPATGDTDIPDVDALEVDSDEGEDDEPDLSFMGLSSKRLLELRTRALRDAYTSPLATARELADIPSAEYLEPTTDHDPETSMTPVDSSSRPLNTNDSSQAGKPKTFMERNQGLSDLLGYTDESQRRGKRKDPWLEVIDKHWDETTQAARPSVQTKHVGLAALSAAAGLDQSTVNEYEAMMKEAQQQQSATADEDGSEVISQPQSKPLFGEGKEQESAGSRIFFDLLPSDLAATIFYTLKDETAWQRMHHQAGEVPRLVCCQGTIAEDGSRPVYRHPSDQTLPVQSWTPAVDAVRKAAEQAVGHTLNHALIQLYRSGTDYISEHSDKTLDIVKESLIVNVSFGAQRTMRLRTKRVGSSFGAAQVPRTTHRVPMPHNSMIQMSPTTNAEYLHGINADKRPAIEFSEAEKAFGGERISLTFRHIGTFLNHDSSLIWGQGATANTKESAKRVINADAAESERLVRAFGAENQSSTVDWERIYREGSDVLHVR